MSGEETGRGERKLEIKNLVSGLREDLKPDEIELYESESFSVLARNTMDKVEVCKSFYSWGVGIRVVKEGALGFSFCSDPSRAEKALKGAVKSARVSPQEDYSLPSPQPVESVKQFDPKIRDVNEEEVVDMLFSSMQGASQQASPSKGEISCSHSTTRLQNSNGMDLEEEESLFSAFVLAKKKEATAYDYINRKKLDASVEEIGRRAGEWAEKSQGGKPVDFEGRVVLSSEVISNFFSICVLRNLNGENARRGKSNWELGEKPLQEISLVDSPFRPWAAGTVGFDDEGVPTQEKRLLDGGVARQFVYDTRTANLAGTESTGNGFRSGFMSTPSIGTTNIVLLPPQEKQCPVMDVSQGVFVKELMGFHNMNSVTGDFALDISSGFTIKKGELDQPVRGCMLVGNFLDILEDRSNQLRFGKEEKGRSWFFTPRMRFPGKVISK